MKRLARGMVVFVVAITLYLILPYLNQKLLVTDVAAATVLNQLESSEWGPHIVDCINLETSVSRLWSKSNAVELTAHFNHGGQWDETHLVVSGFIGWHATWIAAAPLDTRPVTIYDMNGVGGGSMWAREVPTKVIDAFVRCGAEYGGNWMGNTPPGF